ncbi:carboxypeptidase regulatory-like domain-containing protein [Salinarimonas sp. NSM]|uniref:carboxypeptidase regulatory-like domain-containing protein n=1 Tax=Salinarimonas sp. NSM TaxID=3458003 RepID=UPI00403756F0
MIVIRLLVILLAGSFLGACVTAELRTSFDPAAAAYIFEDGDASVKGQAFLRRRNGDVVRAAGEVVNLIPATEYAIERFDVLYRGSKFAQFAPRIENTPQSYLDAVRQTTTDADGNFAFENISAGRYIIQTQVYWEVPNSILPSGGSFYDLVNLQPGQELQVILAGQ